MASATRILWRSRDMESLERFVGRQTATGWRLEGVVLLDHHGYVLRYGDDLWHAVAHRSG